MSDLDLPAEDAIGVWHDLELALARKNGYGGDVAEIYAYRLVPPSMRDRRLRAAEGRDFGEQLTTATKQASVASENLTRIARRFVDLHEGATIAIQTDRDVFRAIDLSAEEFAPFDWRVHLRVTKTRSRSTTLSIQRARDAIDKVAEHNDELIAALEELEALRAKDRLRADAHAPEGTDDLPPDAPTGLYLDRPFDDEDFQWIKMAFEAYGIRHDGGPKRATQIMLVFQEIRRNARSTHEFLRVMNTIILPLLRRIRLKEQPHLTTLGAAEP